MAIDSFYFQRLWHDHIFKNVTEEDKLQAYKKGHKFYKMLPSYKHLVINNAYQSLMEAKHKQVYEYLIKIYPATGGE